MTEGEHTEESLFGVSFISFMEELTVIRTDFRCPKCNRPMTLIIGDRITLGCDHCALYVEATPSDFRRFIDREKRVVHWRAFMNVMYAAYRYYFSSQ